MMAEEKRGTEAEYLPLYRSYLQLQFVYLDLRCHGDAYALT